MDQPSEKSIKRMRIYVEKYMQKTGTSGHPEIRGDRIGDSGSGQ